MKVKILQDDSTDVKSPLEGIIGETTWLPAPHSWGYQVIIAQSSQNQPGKARQWIKEDELVSLKVQQSSSKTEEGGTEKEGGAPS